VGRGAFHDPRTVAGVRERRKPVPAHIGGLEPMTVMLVDVTAIDAARRHHLAGTERLLRFDHDVSVPQTGPLNHPAANQPRKFAELPVRSTARWWQASSMATAHPVSRQARETSQVHVKVSVDRASFNCGDRWSVNHPGFAGDSTSWEGWGHDEKFGKLPEGAARARGPDA
jgi:hypothetical protein